MNDIIEKHSLSDGRSTWIQRHKIAGIRKPFYSVVVCAVDLLEAPEITSDLTKDEAYAALAEVLKADVLEEA